MNRHGYLRGRERPLALRLWCRRMYFTPRRRRHQLHRVLKRFRVALALLALVCGSASPGAWLTATAWTQSAQSIATWSQAYQIDPGYMSRILYCESRFDPTAYNPASGASGIAQWEPATWAELVAAENADTRMAPGLDHYDPEYRSLWDIDAAIHVMAWALAHGQAWRWSCA